MQRTSRERADGLGLVALAATAGEGRERGKEYEDA